MAKQFQGKKNMDSVLYTGTDAEQSISGLDFSPDLVWIKGRSGATGHQIYDTVRGTTDKLDSSTTEAAQTVSTGLTTFNADGFTIGDNGGINTSGSTYVAWAWDAGEETVEYAADTITDQVINKDEAWSSTSALTTPTQLFNGNLSNGATYFGSSTQNITTATFTATKIRIRTNAGSVARKYVINGTDYNMPNTGSNASQWHEIVDFGTPTSITSFQVQSGDNYTLYAVEVDGRILVDSSSLLVVPAIPSTVRANPEAGFSVVRYTGTTGQSCSHGLTQAPEFIIEKEIGNTNNWTVQTTAIDGSVDYLYLNTTDAASAYSVDAPTSNVFDIGRNTECIAYLWHSVPGYSKVGKYEGNGTNSNFVYTGFEPQWILIKRTDASGTNWVLWDNVRYIAGADGHLFANLNDSETTGLPIRSLSNGFELTVNQQNYNTDGGDYVYMAFAERPFGIRPKKVELEFSDIQDFEEILNQDVLTEYTTAGEGASGVVESKDTTTNKITVLADDVSDFTADGSRSMTKPVTDPSSKRWTWAAWVKRSKIDSTQWLFGGDADNYGFTIGFGSANNLEIYKDSNTIATTHRTFTDPASWMHLLVSHNSVDGSGIKVYINGELLTDSDFSTMVQPSLGDLTDVNVTGKKQVIGNSGPNNDSYFGGYVAEVHFIDGQVLTPDAFTNTNAGRYDQLVPKQYDGWVGTRGYNLSMADTSDLGKDFSTSSDDWTATSVGSVVDTPNNYETDLGLGGEQRGNYCVMSSVDMKEATLTNGNLEVFVIDDGTRFARGTIGVNSGKWYWECLPSAGTSQMLGVADVTGNGTSIDSNTFAYYALTGVLFGATGQAASWSGSTLSVGDVLGVALDMDNETLQFYKNGSLMGTAWDTNLSGRTVAPWVGTGGGLEDTTTFNFGATPFQYPAPTGYKTLNTNNIDDGLIVEGNTAMDVVTWTGNGSTQTISGLSFSPDLVWYKCRSSASNLHGLFDTVRGVTKQLYSSNTTAETTYSGVTAFNSDGFDLGSDDGGNQSTETYVAWCWDAGDSAPATNTLGSIQSTVKANPTTGFSIVTWTGTGANDTIGHGLGVAPKFVLTKNRSDSQSWGVYHDSLGGTQLLSLDLDSAASASSTAWNNTDTNSSVVHLGSGPVVNGSSNEMVAYCWSEVEGYSKFGSYTGNNSATDGPFVYTGFSPAFVMIKVSSGTTGHWVIYDNKRDSTNLNSKKLAANLDVEENETSNLGGDSFGIDFLSNGFKIRTTGPNHNNSGATYIYAAYGEKPLQYLPD